MRIEVEREELLKGWQIAQKYTPMKTTMEALNGIRVSAMEDGKVQLEASDLKSSVKYPVFGQVDEVGEAVLNAAIFGDMVKKAGSERVELSTTDRRGTLTTGTSKMRFALIPAATFPKLPGSIAVEEICELLVPDFIRIVVEGSSAASNPSEFPKYMGTCLLRTSGGKLTVVSTDGRRLSYSQTPSDVNLETDLLLPASNLKELVKTMTLDGRVKIKADASMVWFIQEGAEYAIRRIDATFPKYERILKEEVAATLRGSKKEMLPALERVEVIAKNDPDRKMVLSLKDELTLRARAAGLGTVRETVEGLRIEGAELSLGFNVNFLLSGLKAVRGDDVLIEFSGAEEQARIYDGDSRDFMYMLMSMRVSEEDLSDDISDEDVIDAGISVESDDDIVDE